MRNKLSKKIILINTKTSIKKTLELLKKNSKKVKFPGLAFIINKDLKLLGIISNGDLRRLLSKKPDLELEIDKFAIKNPIFVTDNKKLEETYLSIISQFKKRNLSEDTSIRCIPVLNKNKKLIDVVDFYNLSNSFKIADHNYVAIYGLGFVGLTLAAFIASKSIKVYGIDKNINIINNLIKGTPHFHEPELKDFLKSSFNKKKISFNTKINKLPTKHIIAVSVNINKNNNKVDFSNLVRVCNDISKVLKINDHVMLRSTVPIGTTRDLVLGILESKSGLKCGVDFNLSFCPERTIEGNALEELENLPQIVGGYTDSCLEKAMQFWSKLCPTVVKLDNLESAELVKLANNSFRDLSFAFSNELVNIADRFNLSLNDTIKKANKDYPRNRIPISSPGVGGYCLTKDPYLMSFPYGSKKRQLNLSYFGRKINSNTTYYPIKIIKKFCDKEKLKINSLKVFVIGLAFKGSPPTDDIRMSQSIKLIKKLKNMKISFKSWDAVLDKYNYKDYNFVNNKNLTKELDKSDVILILNNNQENKEKISKIFKNSTKPKLIFDGWSILTKNEVLSFKNLYYGDMGSLSSSA